MIEERHTYLVFDKKSSVPFYIREEVRLGVNFHNLTGVVSEPEARAKAESLGFDKKMKLVRI